MTIIIRSSDCLKALYNFSLERVIPLGRGDTLVLLHPMKGPGLYVRVAILKYTVQYLGLERGSTAKEAIAVITEHRSFHSHTKAATLVRKATL